MYFLFMKYFEALGFNENGFYFKRQSGDIYCTRLGKLNGYVRIFELAPMEYWREKHPCYHNNSKTKINLLEAIEALKRECREKGIYKND